MPACTKHTFPSLSFRHTQTYKHTGRRERRMRINHQHKWSDRQTTEPSLKVSCIHKRLCSVTSHIVVTHLIYTYIAAL